MATQYDKFLKAVNDRFVEVSRTEPLFVTGATSLGVLYRRGFKAESTKQHHTCHTCYDFLHDYGGLATIDASGKLTSALWAGLKVPAGYQKSVDSMARAVEHSYVTEQFFTSDKTLGRPKTGKWTHLSLDASNSLCFVTDSVQASVYKARSRSNHATVTSFIYDVGVCELELACQILASGRSHHAEKTAAQANSLRMLGSVLSKTEGAERRNNLVWRWVASAPEGFCHPRAGMLGCLIMLIRNGLDGAALINSFNEKMAPDQYRRPQAAPTLGAIDAAEKLFKAMGAERSLERRYLRPDDSFPVWWLARSDAEDRSDGSLFGHLKPSGSSFRAFFPNTNITWAKFKRDVLPKAKAIYVKAPEKGPYTALTTAVHEDAPALLQWDGVSGKRNPVALYFWQHGGKAEQFGLSPDTWHEVPMLLDQPSMWYTGDEKNGAGVMFVIPEARESKQPGLALFPETLKSEFHGVRSVIEAYSKTAKLQGLDGPQVAGLMLQRGQGWFGLKVRVYTETTIEHYTIDRWE